MAGDEDDESSAGGAAGPVPAAGRELAGIELDLGVVWAAVLHRELTSIRPRDDFFEIGGDDKRAVELLDGIEEAFGVRLLPSELDDAPTLRGLAAVTKAKARLLFGHVTDPVQLIAGSPERTPVLCISPMGGTVLPWRRAAELLDPRTPLYATEATGFDSDGSPMERVGDIADYRIAQLRALVGTGPVVLCGHSFGGTVAYEMAVRLGAAGQEVAGLVMLDTTATRHLDDEPLTLARLRPILRLRLRRERRAIRARLALRARHLGLLRTSDGESRVRWVIQAQRIAYRRYRPGPYDGAVTLITVDSNARRRDEGLGWRALVSGEIELCPVPGDHRAMLGQRWVGSTAAAMDACFRRMSEPRATRGTV